MKSKRTILALFALVSIVHLSVAEVPTARPRKIAEPANPEMAIPQYDTTRTITILNGDTTEVISIQRRIDLEKSEKALKSMASSLSFMSFVMGASIALSVIFLFVEIN